MKIGKRNTLQTKSEKLRKTQLSLTRDHKNYSYNNNKTKIFAQTNVVQILE